MLPKATAPAPRAAVSDPRPTLNSTRICDAEDFPWSLIVTYDVVAKLGDYQKTHPELLGC